MDERIKRYLTAIDRELARGRTTEHTHRPALKTFIESLGDVLATNEPGREKCGAPDYVVTKAGPLTVGYIETKDVGKPLGDAEKSEQLQRYRRSLPNLILTDNVVHKSAPRFTDINPATGDYLEQCRVYINESQYFENVPQEVWETEIGGYQVCFQWIKDRRGEELNYADLSHYQRMVQAVYESLQITHEIDSVAPNWPTT